MLLALIGEAQHDREMARSFHRRYLDPQRETERETLKRGITNGELSDALDVDAALDALSGPILYRALTGARIPRRFIDTLIADTLKSPSRSCVSRRACGRSGPLTRGSRDSG